ncbi:MAG: rhodanese-like domain-containing protein [Tepidimonas sp.]|uniref:rhodanese-like domain-containing protein n=1 Tax=Tepidimonas sp. TaxID=2002775 RepID=UPI0040550A46
MDFLVQNWMLVAVAIGSATMLVWPAVSGAGWTGVTPTEAVTLINREKAVVIDVCSPEEYAAGHVMGARNIPLDVLLQQLPQAVKNKATPLVLVCASGFRSRRAVAVAKKLGYERAVSLAGGLAAWRSANLPIQKA